MTEYTINPTEGSIYPATNIYGTKEKNTVIFTVMSTLEFQESKYDCSAYCREFLHSPGSIRYCKAELFKECITGTLRIPQKSEQRSPLLSFAFYITDNTVIFIEDTENLKMWLEKRLDKFHDIYTTDGILLQFMEQMIEDDVLYLSYLENEIQKMEDSLVHSVPKNFFLLLTRYRRKLSEMNAYYEQLADMGELMQSQICSTFVHDSELWNKYTRRAERLQNHVQLLRENILQLRELYQSQQDAKQNKVMGILTVVTTLFLPLTLLTGWYGMNFAYMPELHWKYGYLAAAVAAAIIVILEIIFFKKKKFF